MELAYIAVPATSRPPFRTCPDRKKTRKPWVCALDCPDWSLWFPLHPADWGPLRGQSFPGKSIGPQLWQRAGKGPGTMPLTYVAIRNAKPLAQALQILRFSRAVPAGATSWILRQPSPG